MQFRFLHRLAIAVAIAPSFVFAAVAAHAATGDRATAMARASLPSTLATLDSGPEPSPRAQGPESDPWTKVTDAQARDRLWDSILNTPMGVAGLNQLAIEGFISYDCEKSLYREPTYGMSFMLRVECPTPRGVSSALGYDEMRILYSTFEGHIESFSVERVHRENRDRVTPLSDARANP